MFMDNLCISCKRHYPDNASYDGYNNKVFIRFIWQDYDKFSIYLTCSYHADFIDVHVQVLNYQKDLSSQIWLKSMPRLMTIIHRQYETGKSYNEERGLMYLYICFVFMFSRSA